MADKNIILKENDIKMYPQTSANLIEGLKEYVENYFDTSATPEEIGEFLRNYSNEDITVTRNQNGNSVIINFIPFPQNIIEGIKKNPWCFKMCCVRHKTRLSQNKSGFIGKAIATEALYESKPKICYNDSFNPKTSIVGINSYIKGTFTFIPNQSFESNLNEIDFNGLSTGVITRRIDREIDSEFCSSILNLTLKRNRTQMEYVRLHGNQWIQGFGFGFVYMGENKTALKPEIIRVGNGFYRVEYYE